MSIAPSNYTINVNGTGVYKDLVDIFESYPIPTNSTTIVGYTVKIENVDLGKIFIPLASNGNIGYDTGFKFNDADLRTFFAKKQVVLTFNKSTSALPSGQLSYISITSNGAAVACIKTDSTTIAGIYYSQDNGITWVLSTLNFSPNVNISYKGISISNTYAVACSANNIYYSNDSGKNWYATDIVNNWVSIAISNNRAVVCSYSSNSRLIKYSRTGGSE